MINKKKIIQWMLRAIFVVAGFWLLFWVINKNEGWFGGWNAAYTIDRGSHYISNFYPGAKLSAVKKDERGDAYQSVVKSPIYFTVAPRGSSVNLPAGEFKWQKARVKLTYRTFASEGTDLRFGLITNNDYQSYAWRNMTSISEKLATLPRREEENGWWLIGGDLSQVFENWQWYKGFQANVVELPENFAYSNLAMVRTFNIDTRFRGYHKFVTCVDGGENLSFKFKLFDLNRHSGADPVRVIASSAFGWHQEFNLDDDGIDTANGQIGVERELVVVSGPAGAGDYLLEFQASSDILIDKIITEQLDVSVLNNVYLAEDEFDSANLPRKLTNKNPLELSVSGDYLSLYTTHRDALQTVKIDDKDFSIDKIFEYYTAPISKENKDNWQIVSSVGDLQLATNGCFYLRGNYCPTWQKSDFSSGDWLVDSAPATSANGWQTREWEFDVPVSSAAHYADGNRLIFSIWAPFLNLADNKFNLEISGVEVSSE